MSTIVVIGDYNADLVIYVDRFPQPGETLNGNRFLQGAGGKGSNQAIAAARLGATSYFVGAIGADNFGAAAKEVWQSHGVDTRYVREYSDVDTAAAMIYVNSDGDNMIVVNQAANLRLSPADVDALQDTIASADGLICTLGVPLPATERALALAHEAGTTTILNPAPAAQLSGELLATVDYLTPNETELAAIAGQDGGSDDIIRVARDLMQRDDQVFIITLGGEGARWITRDDTGIVPAYDVDVVDTVGAGDVFNAGLAVALAEGRTLEDAIRFASAGAALAVTQVGAVDGIPTREEVDALYAE